MNVQLTFRSVATVATAVLVGALGASALSASADGSSEAQSSPAEDTCVEVTGGNVSDAGEFHRTVWIGRSALTAE